LAVGPACRGEFDTDASAESCDEIFGGLADYTRCDDSDADVCRFAALNPTGVNCEEMCSDFGTECLAAYGTIDNEIVCPSSETLTCGGDYSWEQCACSNGCGGGPVCAAGDVCIDGLCSPP
jgi:hypothetical protein